MTAGQKSKEPRSCPSHVPISSRARFLFQASLRDRIDRPTSALNTTPLPRPVSGPQMSIAPASTPCATPDLVRLGPSRTETRESQTRAAGRGGRGASPPVSREPDSSPPVTPRLRRPSSPGGAGAARGARPAWVAATAAARKEARKEGVQALRGRPPG